MTSLSRFPSNGTAEYPIYECPVLLVFTAWNHSRPCRPPSKKSLCAALNARDLNRPFLVAAGTPNGGRAVREEAWGWGAGPGPRDVGSSGPEKDFQMGCHVIRTTSILYLIESNNCKGELEPKCNTVPICHSGGMVAEPIILRIYYEHFPLMITPARDLRRCRHRAS